MNRERRDVARDAALAHAHEGVSMITLADMIADAVEAGLSWLPTRSDAEIQELVNEWARGENLSHPMELVHEHLGWTQEQYRDWVWRR